ncbi:MAG TPA: BlaI/MecI/CopY family transcriptional regulator [Thermoanaerobaculia bacterium]|nr:BlaI/MecI/CopY family transcriptional regulator [Thermoanaerobaculia bacterium]
MAAKRALSSLSRRERQIMEVLYREGRATASEVLERLPDPPGYSAVRALLRILENKGQVRHAADGNRYVYEPRLPRDRAGRPALAGVLETFFDGSAEKAVAALLDLSRHELTDADLDRLSDLIEQARLEGR